MGYSTRYTLSAEYHEAASPQEAIARMVTENKEAAYVLQPDGSPGENGKWYEHEGDMLALSRTYPHLLFTLEGQGEDPHDAWKKYFHDGKVQVEKATVTIAPFDPSKLRGKL